MILAPEKPMIRQPRAAVRKSFKYSDTLKSIEGCKVATRCGKKYKKATKVLQ